jgi:hypothetical protein
MVNLEPLPVQFHAQSDWQLIGHLVWVKTASPFLYKELAGMRCMG